MNRRIVQALPILAIIVLAACSSDSVSQSLVPQTQSLAEQNAMPPDALTGPASGDIPFLTTNPVRRLCALPESSDRMECLSLVRTDVVPTLQEQPQVSGDAEKCPFTKGEGYCPIDLQEAYKLPSLSRGYARVVAIVDAYGYHHAASDVAFYRKTMGLRACSTESKCLRIVNQEGKSSPLPPEPPPSDDWKGEQSLDLDMVSAICPNCKIILVQTNDNGTNNLYTGVKEAGALHAKYIGASWGGGPEGGDDPRFHQPGVVISAAAGDNGGGGPYGGPAQPCTFTYVVCVGGTHLVRADGKRGWSETVWNDFTFYACGGPCGATGSACSTKIAKPMWQTDKGCHMRSAADTSATASLRSPVIVYNSEEPYPTHCTPPNCFWDYGGTSASTQIISAVFALGGNANFGQGASYVWKHRTGNLYDVTLGNNIDPRQGITCASHVPYICTAKFGYDGPTGLGTPNGIGAF
jgi:hypothetical protein